MSKKRFGFGGDDVPEDQTQQSADAQPNAPPPEPASNTQVAQTKSLDDAQRESDERKVPDDAPQHVKDAAARLGGDVPRAAPKGGEGVRAETRTDHPELDPPPPPPEYRVAPVQARDLPDREAAGERPDEKAIADATTVRVRAVDPNTGGFFSSGVPVGREWLEVSVARIAARGKGHVRALAIDPRVEVEIVK